MPLKNISSLAFMLFCRNASPVLASLCSVNKNRKEMTASSFTSSGGLFEKGENGICGIPSIGSDLESIKKHLMHERETTIVISSFCQACRG